ncbi:MAG: hypothetical protein ACUVQ0_01575 [Thermoproteota archaeon]
MEPVEYSFKDMLGIKMLSSNVVFDIDKLMTFLLVLLFKFSNDKAEPFNLLILFKQGFMPLNLLAVNPDD